MERRELVRWLLATGGLAAMQGLSEREVLEFGRAIHAQSRGTQPGSVLKSLTPAQARAVTIAAEHIIPASDTPGATDARVTDFIDRMLAEWYTPAERDLFVNGLAELDRRSRTQHSRAFVECAAVEQIGVLTSFDDDVVSLRRSRAPNANDHWFATLKYLTVWGYCTSEPAMRKLFKSHPQPMRFDGNAPVAAS